MNLPGRDMPWKQFLKRVKEEYSGDAISDVAGSVTFFGLLALFPFLLFLVALVGMVIDPEQTQQVVSELGKVAPASVTDILNQRLRSVSQGSNAGLLTVGVLGALWAASGGVAALMRGLNTAYDVEDERSMLKTRAIAIGVTIVAGIVALVATVVAVASGPVADLFGEPIRTVVLWLRFPVAGLLMMTLWSFLYWALPDVDQRFKFVTPGAIVGVLIWLAASWGFSVYVKNFGSYEATYGSLGAVIVLLLWMWITAQVLLIGAEVNAVLEHASAEGKPKGAKKEGERAPGDREEVRAGGRTGRGEAAPAYARTGITGAPDRRRADARRVATVAGTGAAIGAALVGILSGVLGGLLARRRPA